MESRKAARKLTDEIINEFRLPRTLCYPFINEHILMGIAVGFDLGRSQSSKHKPVVKLDANGKIHTVYDSMAMAARANNVAVQNISVAIKKGKKSAGFNWKLQNPDDHYLYR